MKYFVLIIALMVFLSIGVMFSMVEMYRIETNSYNTRMNAFYDAFFEYMADSQDVLPHETVVAEQPENANDEFVM